MRVNHLVGGRSSWGAAKGAVLLSRALENSGLDSRVFAKQDFGLDQFDVLKPTSRIQFSLNWRLAALGEKVFHKGMSNFDLGLRGGWSMKDLRQCDVIHLHWVSGVLSTYGVRSLSGQRVVWSLRDYNPISGGCYVPATGHEAVEYCDRFVEGCGHCPILGSKWNWDVSRLNWYLKKYCYSQDIVFTVFNADMKAELDRHDFLKKNRVVVMPNIAAKPTNAQVGSKRSAGDSRKMRVLFSAMRHSDQWKGYSMLISALNRLEHENLELVTMGSVDFEAEEFKGVSEHHGVILDQSLKQEIIGSCDLFVAPYLRDTFGKTVVEAMSLGIPVLGFNRHGVKEIVGNGGGVLVEPDVESLTRGFLDVLLLSEEEWKELSEGALQTAAKFTGEVVAKEYIALYDSL